MRPANKLPRKFLRRRLPERCFLKPANGPQAVRRYDGLADARQELSGDWKWYARERTQANRLLQNLEKGF